MLDKLYLRRLLYFHLEIFYDCFFQESMNHCWEAGLVKEGDDGKPEPIRKVWNLSYGMLAGHIYKYVAAFEDCVLYADVIDYINKFPLPSGFEVNKVAVADFLENIDSEEKRDEELNHIEMSKNLGRFIEYGLVRLLFEVMTYYRELIPKFGNQLVSPEEQEAVRSFIEYLNKLLKSSLYKNAFQVYKHREEEEKDSDAVTIARIVYKWFDQLEETRVSWEKCEYYNETFVVKNNLVLTPQKMRPEPYAVGSRKNSPRTSPKASLKTSHKKNNGKTKRGKVGANKGKSSALDEVLPASAESAKGYLRGSQPDAGPIEDQGNEFAQIETPMGGSAPAAIAYDVEDNEQEPVSQGIVGFFGGFFRSTADCLARYPCFCCCADSDKSLGDAVKKRLNLEYDEFDANIPLLR